MITAYLDTNICSAAVTGDLEQGDPARREQSATDALLRARDQGALDGVAEIRTSIETRREQERTKEPVKRAAMEAAHANIPLVSNDHVVEGFSHSSDQRGGFIANPLVSDIVDEGVFKALRAVGISEADARHIMYAVTNCCSRFVTNDNRDILPNKAIVEAICPSLKIVKPSELAAELGVRVK